MKKKNIVTEILRLETAVRDVKQKQEDIWRLRERLNYVEELFKAKTYAYHVLPVKYLGTVFSEYAEELREYNEWISDRRFGVSAWSRHWEDHEEIMGEYRRIASEKEGRTSLEGVLTRECHAEHIRGELPVAKYFHAPVHCDSFYEAGDGMYAFKFSDPYGEFISQPMAMDIKKAREYYARVVDVVLHTEYEKAYDEGDFADFLDAEVTKNDRVKPVYNRYKPIFKTYMYKQYREMNVSWMKVLPYTKRRKEGEKEIVLSPLLQYVKEFANVSSENEAIEALDEIQRYVSKSEECTFNKRFSPTDYRIILNDRTLYQFFWCNDMLCFSCNKGNKFPTEREDRPERGDNILCDAAYEFDFREYAGLMSDMSCLEYRMEKSDFVLKKDPEKVLRPLDAYLPYGERACYKGLKKRKLIEIREELLAQYENYKQRFIDRFRYTGTACLLHDYRDLYNVDYNKNCVLCEHPEYYGKWKGTFFDLMDGGMSYGFTILVEQDKQECEENYVKKFGRNLVWHKYYMKNGAKSPFEDMRYFDYEFIRRASDYDIDSDICIKYVGLCDSASYIDGTATVHLVDPSGDAVFYNVDVSPDMLGDAIGKICTISCVYNYCEEGRYRMLEFEVLPFTLQERLGSYPEDVVRVRKNLVIRGRQP